MGFVALVCDQMHGGTLLSEGFVGFFFFVYLANISHRYFCREDERAYVDLR